MTMGFIVLAQALAFQRTDPADPTLAVGDEEIVTRGGNVPDYVTTFTVSALANSGLVAYVDRPDPTIVPNSQLPAQVRTPDQPPVLPSDPNGVPPVLGDLFPGETVEDGAPPAEPVKDDVEDAPLPATGDKKEVWEAYAQRPEIGLSQGDAEAMNKQDLMATVRARYDAAHK
jgi:hypothetical protein